jgi:hypothetical protein
MRVARMARIVWRHKGSLSPTVDKSPAVEALEVVVVGTQPIEQVEHGEVTAGPFEAVVIL